MAWFLPALIGGAASIIGGVINKKSAEKQQQNQFTYNEKFRADDRKLFLQDREDERLYSAYQTIGDRSYAEAMRDNERRYAESLLVDDRYYSQAVTASDRDYLDRKRDEDIAQYSADRDFMQNRSNQLAAASAGTRGIDFVKLRDDAVAAGYNPMTALSMAHAYSKNVDYSLQGGVYSPGASYTATTAPSGGGGGGAAPGAVMGSHVPAGGSFMSNGGGYQSQFNPALSSGSFIQEAIERGVDAWTNRPVAKDPLADALRNAFQQDQMAQEVRDSQIPQGFGYDLTKQKPFQPAATVGVPAIPPAGSARMPSGEIEVGGRKYVPVTKPDGRPGRLEASIAKRLDIGPFDTVSPGDWAEIVGEVGEIETIASQPAIRRNVTDDWHIGTSIPDYVKSGVTGSRQFPKGQHYNPWAR